MFTLEKLKLLPFLMLCFMATIFRVRSRKYPASYTTIFFIITFNDHDILFLRHLRSQTFKLLNALFMKNMSELKYSFVSLNL